MPAPFCGSDNDEIGSFQATSAKPDEGNEAGEEWLPRAPAMSMMDENDCEELVASKGNIFGRPILVVGDAYCLVANKRRQIATRPWRGDTNQGHTVK